MAVPTIIGVIWALIAVDLTFLLEINWRVTAHSPIAVITYALQIVLFWPSAIFTLATRALPLIGWQPGWLGLSLLVAACGGGPGLLAGLIAFSWARR